MKKFLKATNTQFILEWYYPKKGKSKSKGANKGKERREIKSLNINEQNFKGSLVFDESWTELKEINCSLNQLTSLDVSRLPKLERLFCHYNQLTKLKLSENLTKLSCSHNLLTSVEFLNKLSNENKEKLTHLDISDNSIRREEDGNVFSPQSLDFLSGFTNLRYLSLGNWDEEVTAYNNFTGSLEPLRNLKNLKKLDISSTDIDKGLENLSDNLNTEDIICLTDKWPTSKVRKIQQQLTNKKSQSNDETTKKVEELNKKITQLEEKISKLKLENQTQIPPK